MNAAIDTLAVHGARIEGRGVGGVLRSVPARAIARAVGATLLTGGVVLGLGVALRHVVWALPVHDLLTHPDLFAATGSALAGLGLLTLARRPRPA